MGHLRYISLFLALIFMTGVCSSEVIKLNITSWENSLQGEWLVAFVAPWCPACRMFSPVWDEFSLIPALSAKVATVDVTESPVLSFVFLVSRLPTVFHIKDGVVRQIEGAPSIDKLQQFLMPKVYSTVKPIPWYYSPASWHMRYFSRFMQVGMAITNVHQHLLDAGYPTWLSFVIIGCATIISGVILGTVLVIVCDCFVPPRPQFLRLFRSSSKKQEDASFDASKTQELTDDLLSSRSTNISEADAEEDEGSEKEQHVEDDEEGAQKEQHAEDDEEVAQKELHVEGDEEEAQKELHVEGDEEVAQKELHVEGDEEGAQKEQHVDEEEEDNGVVVVHRRHVATNSDQSAVESKDQ